MPTIDLEATVKAGKSLSVIAFILTLTLNSILLAMIVRAARGQMADRRRARFLTLAFLTAGDILTGLFSLTDVGMYFHISVSLPPLVYQVSYYFVLFLMPFVYGVAILSLAVEGTRFGRKTAASAAAERPGVLATFVISLVPWILGLLVVTPLCFYPAIPLLDRITSLACICYLLPAVIALCSALFMFCKKHETSLGNQQTQTVALSTVSVHSNPTMYPTVAPLQPSAPPLQYPPPYEPMQGHIANPNEHLAKQYPSNNGLTPTPSSTVNHYNKERVALLIIAVAFSGCVVPCASIQLVPNNQTFWNLPSFWMTFIHELFSWMFYYRSCLLPFLWLTTGTINKPTTA
ncbi:hypothetical protein ElyMa_000769700 [Elysia marginata]|uniref:G-protein coupled receptors family 1 profile domain-containing protein n=1 Tax=Elysia marginata TaxID=1093978 RepID=A0AAV4GTI8_9GAST|nr:hypothetical protein ElyMa_000769700 [Elysia marginata]